MARLRRYEKGSREQEAERTLKRTIVSAPAAAAAVTLFLLTIYAVPIAQATMELCGIGQAAHRPRCLDVVELLPSGKSIADAKTAADWWNLPATPGQIRDFENELENNSFIWRVFGSPVQSTLIRLGAGNERGYVGRDGWLFYRPDVDSLTGPAFLSPMQLRARSQLQGVQGDPRRAIIQFRDQLAARGITLIVMPAPSKGTIHPEKFSPRYDGMQMVRNPSFDKLLADLSSAGVNVCDPSRAIFWRKMRNGLADRDQYLRCDTHWTPEAMAISADELAAKIGAMNILPAREPAGYSTIRQSLRNAGDIAAMFRLTNTEEFFPSQDAAIEVVLTKQKSLLRFDRAADVLLLGDSFANIYSMSQMGWGDAAGLGEQLALRLQRPVDAICINDNGSYATRRALSAELAGGSDRLAGKKLVIWEFSARELSDGDWRLIDMTLGAKREGEFFVPPAGQRVEFCGTVEWISPAPLPGSVPYKDHILCMHVRRADDGAQALVYAWSMKDNVQASAARFRPGQTVTLQLVDWNEVEGRLGRFNRSSPDNDELMLAPACWSDVE